MKMEKTCDEVGLALTWLTNVGEMNELLKAKKQNPPSVRSSDRASFVSGIAVSRSIRLIMGEWLDEKQKVVENGGFLGTAFGRINRILQ